MKSYIENFLRDWGQGKLRGVELYNEDSLKFELGLYLRNKLQKENPNYKVQFERNIVNLFMDLATEERNVATVSNEPKCRKKELLDAKKATIKDKFAKTEIDILIFNGNNPWEKTERYAIELKYSTREDGSTNQRAGMEKDIVFVKQLVTKDVCVNAYAVTLANDIFKKAGQGAAGNCFKNNPVSCQSLTFSWVPVNNIFEYYICEGKINENNELTR